MQKIGIGEFSGAHVIGAKQSIQLWGNAVGECQRAQVSGAGNMIYNVTDQINAYSVGAMADMQLSGYMNDVGTIWQDLDVPAVQEREDFLTRSKVISPPTPADPTLPLRPSAVTVGESFLKEPLPCVLSPLGFHLPKAVKEKIWRG